MKHTPIARITLTVAGGLAVATIVAGCGSGGEVAEAPGTSSSAASSPSAGPSTPSGVSSGRQVVVTGALERGAEPACLVLRAGAGSYDLQGPLVARLLPGDRVTLTGHVVRGVASHCMDGTPFTVTKIGRP